MFCDVSDLALALAWGAVFYIRHNKNLYGIYSVLLVCCSKSENQNALKLRFENRL